MIMRPTPAKEYKSQTVPPFGGPQREDGPCALFRNRFGALICDSLIRPKSWASGPRTKCGSVVRQLAHQTLLRQFGASPTVAICILEANWIAFATCCTAPSSGLVACPHPGQNRIQTPVPVIHLKKVHEWVDKARFVPLIGHAAQYHTLYECTLEQPATPGIVESVYFDHTHFHMVSE